MSLASDRPPVSTYEQALWWLIQNWLLTDFELIALAPLPLEAVDRKSVV